MADIVRQVEIAASSYLFIRNQRIRWRRGELVSFRYPPDTSFGLGQQEKKESFNSGAADKTRPYKLELIKLIDLTKQHLEYWHSRPNPPSYLPELNDFTDNIKTDDTELNKLRKDAAKLLRLQREAATKLITLLERPKLINEFDEMSAIRKMDFLVTVMEGMPETVAGRNYLERPGHELLDIKMLEDLPTSIGFDVGIEANPRFEFADTRAVDEAQQTFPASPERQKQSGSAGKVTKPLLSNTLKVYSLFMTSVLPIAIYAHISASTSSSANLADKLKILIINYVGGPVPDTLIDPNVSLKENVSNVTDWLNGQEANADSPYKNVVGAFERLDTAMKFVGTFDAFDKLLRSNQTGINFLGDLLKATGSTLDLAAVAANKLGKQFAKRLAACAAVVVLVADSIAAYKNINDARKVGDRSVIIGESLKLGGAALTTGVGVYSVFFAGGAALGPVGWAVAGFGIGLILAGEALVTFTKDTDLQGFANMFYFGKEPNTSDKPGDIEFNFYNLKAKKIDLTSSNFEVQIAKFRTLLAPLNLQYTPPPLVSNTGPEISYTPRKELPENSVISLHVYPAKRGKPSAVYKIAGENKSSFDTQFVDKGEISLLSDKWPDWTENRWLMLSLEIPASKLSKDTFGKNSPEALTKEWIEYKQI
jgi:hypothetical protein